MARQSRDSIRLDLELRMVRDVVEDYKKRGAGPTKVMGHVPRGSWANPISVPLFRRGESKHQGQGLTPLPWLWGNSLPCLMRTSYLVDRKEFHAH